MKAMPRKRFGKRGRPRAGTGNTPDPTREQATVVKKSRWALLKNPENLTEKQAVTLRLIELEDPALHRAYLLKESLRLIFQMKHDDAVVELARWIGWARRCRIPEFVELQRSIVTHQDSILAAIEHGLSNGRILCTRRCGHLKCLSVVSSVWTFRVLRVRRSRRRWGCPAGFGVVGRRSDRVVGVCGGRRGG